MLIHQFNDSENALGICGWSGRERSIFFPLRRTAAGEPCRWSWMTASIFTWTQLLIRSSGWGCRLMEAATGLSRNFNLFMCAPQNMCTTAVSRLVILMARLQGQNAARRLAASNEAVLGQRGAVDPGQRVSLALHWNYSESWHGSQQVLFTLSVLNGLWRAVLRCRWWTIFWMLMGSNISSWLSY